MFAWVALAAAGAQAAEPPSLWLRGFAAIAFQPTGVIVDGAGELRAPVLRYGGAVFNDTFVGGGLRVALSPVHVDVAVRASLQPIDILPITIEAVRSSYWESPWGLVPADSVSDQLGPDRRPLYTADRDFAGGAWSLSVAPTLQLKLGPIVGFSSPTFTWISLRPEQTPEAWVFEPYRGLVMAYDDRLLEHTSAILWEAADGADRPLFRVGPVFRGKSAHATGDRSLMLGGVAQWRPGTAPTAPTLLLIGAEYVLDDDFAGPIPFVALLVTVERDLSLQKGVRALPAPTPGG